MCALAIAVADGIGAAVEVGEDGEEGVERAV